MTKFWKLNGWNHLFFERNLRERWKKHETGSRFQDRDELIEAVNIIIARTEDLNKIEIDEVDF
jgi:hypothetical protein